MLGIDDVRIGALRRRTIVDGTIGMARLVGNDLPLGGRFDNDIGTSNRLARVSRVALGSTCTGLT